MLSDNHSHQTMTRCFTPVERIGPTHLREEAMRDTLYADAAIQQLQKKHEARH